jgi:hypothetical protein
VSERSPLVIVVALVLVAALSPDAGASCNAIPDAESAGIGGFAVLVEQDAATLVPKSEPGVIGFKGALGRVDRIHLLPGYTTGFRIQPDGRCIQSVKDRLIVRDVPTNWADAGRDMADLVVSLVTQPAHDGSLQALVLGTQEVCDILDKGRRRIERKPVLALRCEPLPPELERRFGGGFNVRARLPDDGKLLGEDGTPLRGPVAVALTVGVRTRDEHVAMLASIATDSCAAHCGALAENGTLACVDRFYAIAPGNIAVLDPVPCAVTIPDDFTRNDFQDKCEDLPPADPDLAKCADDHTDLQLWEDQCGGVHIPFDWREIRKDISTTPPKDITRVVAGRSATSRTEKGKLSSKRIWIPGREFIGSTPWADPQGTAATVDWRKPEIEPWYPAESPEEVGLRGSVDQDDSIVHVFPRMPVTLACKFGSNVEACMGVGENGGISCACTDRYPADCTCEMLSPPSFFACDGGDFDEMPCTRHAHCNSKPGSGNPSGSCSAQPTCQKDGKIGVWEFPGQASGDKCWVDQACVDPTPWCGKRLFDVSDRKETPSKPELIELDAKIDSGASGARHRRGACKESRANVCNQKGANACDTGECRGYTLRAEEKKD